MVIGLWPFFFRENGSPRLWALVLGGTLCGLALVFPFGLKPVFKVWMKIGHALGWVNTRLILALGFYLIFMPVGTLMRLFGHDPMSRKFDAKAESYRVTKTARPASHMRRLF